MVAPSSAAEMFQFPELPLALLKGNCIFAESLYRIAPVLKAGPAGFSSRKIIYS